MPTYDYLCEANGRTVEVRHGVGAEVRTWSDLCVLADAEVGDTPPAAPVRRLISRPLAVHPGGAGGRPEQAPCDRPGGCGCF